jgi:DNA-sulfur modification-associated
MSKVSANISTEEFLQDQLEMTKDRHEMLSALLSNTMAREGCFLAFASSMGKTGSNGHPNANPVPSFTVLHSLEWISQNIRLGSEMPFMADKIDRKTGRLVVDFSNADEIKQRAPDWTRQSALAAYLAQPHRKFGPIMAVISPAWVENSEPEYWDEQKRAIDTSADFTPIEPEGRVGLLRLEGVQLYALDGQHRVLGIRGLRDLQERGFLQLRAQDGTPRGGVMTKEDFFEKFRLEIEDLQSVFNDTMPVEYTPAIVKGETHSEATRRIRRTFIAINSYAKKTDKGENILLDETDGYAILARQLGVGHTLFKDDGCVQRVNWKSASILSGSSHVTTLSTLKEAATAFLPVVKPEIFGEWRAPVRGMVPLRPTEDELSLGSKLMFNLFDHILSLPIFQILQRTAPLEYTAVLNRWREFPGFDVFAPRLLAEGALERSRGHLLLRPIGQILLVKAVAELTASEADGGHGLGMDFIFRKLDQIDANRGFEMSRPQSVWYGVTYGTVRAKIVTGNKSWAHRLLVHLINGLKDEYATMVLWRNFVSCRTLDVKRQTWKDLGGEVSHFDWGAHQLPKPLND